MAKEPMNTLDLARERATGTDEVAAVHTMGAEDGPVQIVSAALLAHYQHCEAELKRLQAISYVLPAR